MRLREHGETTCPLVIFSTYHSLHKLVRDDLLFETMIADESQYCISRNFFRSVQSICAKAKLYFTATEYHGSEDKGERRNNNERAFGKILGEAAIQDLVDSGILAEPKLHLLVANSRDADPDIVDVDETKDDAIASILYALPRTSQPSSAKSSMTICGPRRCSPAGARRMSGSLPAGPT